MSSAARSTNHLRQRSPMKRTILTFGFLFALFGLALTQPSPKTVVKAANSHTPVQICHHTGSAKNPAVLITVDDDAVPSHVANHGDFLHVEGSCDQECRPGC